MQPALQAWAERHGCLPPRTILLAAEVWIATALLQRENPGREDFSLQEIRERALRENLTGSGALRPTFETCAASWLVAAHPANPDRHRMLAKTVRGRRGLYLPSDSCHPDRESGKSTPFRDEIPEPYHELLGWFLERCNRVVPLSKRDPLLGLRGLGRDLWNDETADGYVKRLREGWG